MRMPVFILFPHLAVLPSYSSVTANDLDSDAYAKLEAMSDTYIRDEPMYFRLKKYGTPAAGDFNPDGVEY